MDCDIPENWNVEKKHCFDPMPITDGPHETPELLEEGIPFVSAEAVSCGNGKIDLNISEAFYIARILRKSVAKSTLHK